MSVELRADPDRVGQFYPTGVGVRAINVTRWENVDIIHLDRRSLLQWLHSRSGCNRWAEGCVLILLGHDGDTADDLHPDSRPETRKKERDA